MGRNDITHILLTLSSYYANIIIRKCNDISTYPRESRTELLSLGVMVNISSALADPLERNDGMGKKVLVTPRSFVSFEEKDAAYDLLHSEGYHILENTKGRTLTEAEIIGYAKTGVEGIIVGIDPLSASVLEQCKDLRAISKYGVGMDNIDLTRAGELGIKVKNAIGTNDVSVAELTIGLLFSMARQIPKVSALVKGGQWERYRGFELTGKTFGIIGAGRIGKEVAKRAKGLQMNVSIYDPYFNDSSFLKDHGAKLEKSLENLLSTADVVSLHLPVTEETRGFVNREFFGRMKPSAILLNTSRGELVNEEELFHALTSGVIAGAAQDVFSVEPPLANHKLLGLDKFLLTSHIGAFTKEAVAKMVNTATRNLLELLQSTNV